MTWRDTERDLIDFFRANGWGIFHNGDVFAFVEHGLSCEDNDPEVNLTELAKHLASVPA